jgi:hypothetical protein
MAWNENTMNALRQWVNPNTSGFSHPIDEGRFYYFIYALWQEEHRLWNEALAREVIETEFRRLHPEWGDALIDRIVKTAHDKGTTVLDYLCHMRERGLA